MPETIELNNLNFHDSSLYAWGIIPKKYQLLMDIDWIMEREIQQNNSEIKISPATLVFKNVWDININISMDNDLIIDYMKILSVNIPKNYKFLPPGTKEYSWHIELLTGSIEFRSIGFSIYQRKNSITKSNTTLTMTERNGISLKTKGLEYQVLNIEH